LFVEFFTNTTLFHHTCGSRKKGYGTIRYINVGSKADETASLI